MSRLQDVIIFANAEAMSLEGAQTTNHDSLSDSRMKRLFLQSATKLVLKDLQNRDKNQRDQIEG